ncbi:short-chain dehydrogenase/reductase SDR [Gorgonomyces haynaldii]|nr:short-chain dehydrogenase/reductase SDR [Gorgonomyces haynaldii]
MGSLFQHFAKMNAQTTASQVIKGISLKGKNVIVTGASSGIGVETAKQLGLAGAKVYLMGRDQQKTSQVIEKLKQEHPELDLGLLLCDLSSLKSVRTVAQEFLSLNKPLDILVNNAGVMAIKERRLSVDGYEMQMATNFFGPFLLTKLLLPSLLRAEGARIVNVSSMAHKRSGINFDDIQSERSYQDWAVYGQSKTANILHAIELQKRYPQLTCVSLHPGVIETELWRHQGVIMRMDKTIEQGAATSVFCATHPVKGGAYYSDCQEARASAHATDPALAARLWDIGERLTQSSSL